MVVKKRTLIIVCIIIAITLVVGSVTTIKYVRQLNEEREKIAQKERFDRAVDREYKQLVREYNNIVETIKDYDYSLSFRYKYVKKLNELLGSSSCDLYPITSYERSTVYDCIDSLRYNKERDLNILKLNATFKAYFGD